MLVKTFYNKKLKVGNMLKFPHEDKIWKFFQTFLIFIFLGATYSCQLKSKSWNQSKADAWKIGVIHSFIYLALVANISIQISCTDIK